MFQEESVRSFQEPKSGESSSPSSLGTVFEWYDFYLYANARPILRGAVLPGG